MPENRMYPFLMTEKEKMIFAHLHLGDISPEIQGVITIVINYQIILSSFLFPH